MAQKSVNKSIESTYVKLSDIEHVLKAPDSYVGSIESTLYERAWVYDEESKRMVQRDLEIVPGLYKIFDEILVNAIDQYTRIRDDPSITDKVTKIDVTIDQEENIISVFNNGKGFDVAMHSEHKMYVPEMILGHLRTSQNYNKSEKKIVGGKNGLGAKLANIYSTEFKIETVDATRGKKYVQLFEKNMSVIGTPKITSTTAKYGSTRVTFKPDLPLFGLDELTDDIVDYMKRRVYDACACTDKSVSVSLNGKKLEYKDFDKYVSAYIGSKTETKRAAFSPNKFWDVIVCMSPDDKAEQLSFVNGIFTRKGGKHVDRLQQHIATKLVNFVKKKKKKVVLKTQYVKDNMWIFVRCNIVNPTFTGQIKEELETPHTKFGTTFEASDKFIEQVAKCGIVERAQALSAYKESLSNSLEDGEKKGTLRGIPKLNDANFAGGDKSHLCTLILTEGDSAKSSARAGLSAVPNGYDYYGLFPLRGKMLNVREATASTISKNEEIQNVIKILGLKVGCKYEKKEELLTLRYGKVMYMTDQDPDGSHIKGLGINFIHSKWPALIKHNFITTFTTPIVKLLKGKGASKKEEVFYSVPDLEKWKETNSMKGWSTKYYKGLGTSTGKEFKEYFKKLKERTVTFIADEEGKSDEAILLAFDKTKADDRKDWLQQYDPNDVIDFSKTEITYQEFVHKELKHFSIYDLRRSVPNICDGLKPSQRKIIYSCLKRNLWKEIRVAQLAGYVSEQSCYHHGETSLCDAIVNLAQNFVGTNNLNLLVPSGQFGTRLSGGKSSYTKDGKKQTENDVASARYIHTYLADCIKWLFDKDDCAILNYLDDDGVQIEPEWYLPTLPLVLVNGCKGIGTGFSTEIPSFNPKDIISNLKLLMEDKEMVEMTPWYKGFTGEIKKENGKFVSYGVYKKINPTTIQITELPIGVWTNKYIDYLESLTSTGAKQKAAASKSKSKKTVEWYIKHIKNNSSDEKVDITVVFRNSSVLTSLLKKPDRFISLMNLSSSKFLSTSNMYLFNSEGIIQKYGSAEDILKEYYLLRMIHYIKRRKHILQRLSREQSLLDNKVRFITAFVEGTIDIVNKDDDDVEAQLIAIDLDMIDDSYDYLTNMPIRSLTKKKIEELKKQRDSALAELKKMEGTTPTDLFKTDLAKF